ncbi:hypothetical protein QJS10_CPA09g00316 [Acorus calamus]|uniref:Uncharacterized protein n=1 Tax=Acorus calamus TaxID=4465 RepID=A0AAV9E6K7_ACOCL|nr:hypothetical protein QJS10_CPA09g00316 [Acorus calamus]
MFEFLYNNLMSPIHHQSRRASSVVCLNEMRISSSAMRPFLLFMIFMVLYVPCMIRIVLYDNNSSFCTSV